jgi:hypothetical protein
LILSGITPANPFIIQLLADDEDYAGSEARLFLFNMTILALNDASPMSSALKNPPSRT